MPDGTDATLPTWGARFLRRLRSQRFRVADGSMAPTLLPGDCLYVDRGAYRESPPARGDVVVVRDPEVPRRFLVKRVTFVPGQPPLPDAPRVPPRSVYVLGDNLAESRDSRKFGAVPLELVVGRVWFRYAPAGRRGSVTVTFK